MPEPGASHAIGPGQFSCRLDPTPERWKLTYLNAQAEPVGTATVMFGGTAAVADTAWGAFTLEPYEAGEARSHNLLEPGGELLATFYGELQGSLERFVIRDESAAPMLIAGSLDGDANGQYALRTAGGRPVGAVLCGTIVFKPEPLRRIRCLYHEAMAGFSEPLALDIRVLPAITLVLAIMRGDPHDETDLGMSS